MITPTPEFWKVFKETNGALSCSESLFIIQAAALAPEGNYLECGVAFGKSAMSAAYSLKNGMFALCDTHFEDEEIAENVVRKVEMFANKKNIIRYTSELSTNRIQLIDNYSYVMLDTGDHDQVVIDEVNLIKNRMVKGGVIVMHDLDSQFLRVREGYDYLLSTGNYEEIKPNWEEINNYVNENNLEEGNISWHHNELMNPNFVGALRRK